MVMSLVENFARRRHRPIELMQAVETLRKRGYEPAAIASKIGVTAEWVRLLGELFDKGEQRLISGVEMGPLPIGLAIHIARTSDLEIHPCSLASITKRSCVAENSSKCGAFSNNARAPAGSCVTTHWRGAGPSAP